MIAAGERHTHAEVGIWNFQTGLLLASIKTNHNGGVGQTAFSPNNNTLATSDLHDGNQIFLWNTKTGGTKNRLIGDQWLISSLFFSPDGALLINAGHNRSATVEIWDVSNGKLLQTLIESSTGTAFAFPMLDGKTVLIISNRGIKLRDLRNRKILRSFSLSGISARELLKVALSPEGKFLALTTRLSQGGAETTELWSVAAGQLVHRWQENIGNKNSNGQSSVQALAFSPNSKFLASSSNDASIKLWDTLTGKLRGSLNIQAQSLAFSPDGETLAIATQREVQLWKVDALLKGTSQ
ncbi:WD40-like Beta Propeller Repeat [Abditibacterium utsteinense]|uniref:WD40-like Beta Propeller Repeat n=2 Tax=Abditibacterium utsteinense TaxID=1960156 RepID=A0A2S8SNN8_9BACT|nr:WD40-like Beta Propeller Repeat [Abditibacterium utsteinense]